MKRRLGITLTIFVLHVLQNHTNMLKDAVTKVAYKMMVLDWQQGLLWAATQLQF